MYRFLDQPITRLDNGARFTLWAMRAWVSALEQSECPRAALAQAFARMGVLEALPDFHMALALINRDALDRIALAPLRCRVVAEDEAVLLGLWRDAAAGADARVGATLSLLLAREAVASATRALMLGAAKLEQLDLAPATDHPVTGTPS